MKAYYIYPETIGAFNEWSNEWLRLIVALGYDATKPPKSILIAPIETNQ